MLQTLRTNLDTKWEDPVNERLLCANVIDIAGRRQPLQIQKLKILAIGTSALWALGIESLKRTSLRCERVHHENVNANLAHDLKRGLM